MQLAGDICFDREQRQWARVMAALDEKIGGLIVGMQRLVDDVAEIKRDNRENARAAHEWRSSTDRRLAVIEDDYADLAKSMAAVKSVTDNVTRWQLMFAGGVIVLSAVVSMLVPIATAAWKWLNP